MQSGRNLTSSEQLYKTFSVGIQIGSYLTIPVETRAVLQIVNLEKRFGARTLFSGVSFTLTRGERLSLVGRNGTGKSTLFRMILDQEHPDEGEIVVPKGYTIGHLSQHLKFSEPTILAEACRGLPADSIGEEYKAEIILTGLGFTEEDLLKPASQFSGGFQIRIELARVLLSEPNLLLLDEPTNYLDIVSARWLEEFLKSWPNEMMLISHDRTFLDAVSTHTMIIHRQGVRRVQGKTQKLYDVIAQDEIVHEQTRLNKEKKKQDLERFIAKNSARASTAAMAQSRVKQLEKLDIEEELQEAPVLDFDFTGAQFFGRYLVEVNDVSFAYPNVDPKTPSREILRDFSLAIGKRDRIGVIGKNGRGKSTFLKILAGELAPTAGSVAPSVNTSIGYFGQTNIQRLSENLTVEDEISSVNPQMHRTKVRGICGTMMFSGDDALKRIKLLSGGERSRVLLGKLLAQPTNLLLLDEPTNHLDVESVAALVKSLESYEGAVVLVTHDEFMLRALATRLVVFTEQGAQLLEGNYEYFLSRGGWEDAATAASAPTEQVSGAGAGSKPLSPGNLARERERMLSRLDKRISDVENKIEALEDRLKENEALMMKAVEAADGDEAGRLGMASANLSGQIEDLFGEFERLTAERKTAEQKTGAEEGAA